MANILIVKKSSSKWKMCQDFTNLDLVCPKDTYPLPNMDTLIDRVLGYKMLNFMDVYSGYK